MRVRNPAARFRGYHSQPSPHVLGEHLLTWQENLGWHPPVPDPDQWYRAHPRSQGKKQRKGGNAS